jgi:glycosyltransferase involved in cell wall biosynthesis
MNILFSIISPIQNEEKYIEKCLDSLVSQDYDQNKYEILVIDGMSTDTTRTIVGEYAKKFKNIKLIDNPNKTVPYALNIGIKNAKGNVIIRVDGHASINEDYLKLCEKYLRLTKAECVGGVIESINKTYIGKAIALAMSSPFGVGNVRFRTNGKAGFVDCLAFGAYRKEVFDKIGYFDEQFIRCQDDEFNYRLRKYGGKIFLTPEIKSYYYPRSNLIKLWRQYFQYGYWKIRVLEKHFKMMQIRQFVPPVFVFSLITTGIFSLFSGYSYSVFLFIIMLYIIACFYFYLKISLKNGFRYTSFLPLIFLILHISYGLGFLWGIIRLFRFRIK